MSVHIVNHYPTVHLCKDGKRKMEAIHRLVAKAFLPYKPGLHVNHINSIRTDNRLENLELVTPQQNVTHSVVAGFRDGKGEGNNNSKLTGSDVLSIRAQLAQGTSRAEIASAYGVKKSCIDKIATRRTWPNL